MNTHRRALVVATTVLVSGVLASLAGNLQAINLGRTEPGIGAYVSAILWPLFLFGAIEVMLHTPWIRSWRDGLTKFAGLSLVAFVSFWISYWHMAHVLTAYGYDSVSSHLGPVAIDMTMAMATLALNRVGQARRAPAFDPYAPSKPSADFADTLAWTPEDDAAVDLWTGLASKLDSTTTPAVPVTPGPLDIAPVSPAPVRPESIPLDATEAISAWLTADPDERPSAGDMAALLAAAFGVSTRTVRRWRTTLQNAF